MDDGQYGSIVQRFVDASFSEATLGKYYKAKKALYLTQLFVPTISAGDAPKAFGVEQEVKPMRWIAVYKGKVVPAESGKFRFIGFGDDVLVVRFNGRMVLDGGISRFARLDGSSRFVSGNGEPYKIAADHTGPSFQVEAGHAYPMEILIGERPGGSCAFQLYIQQNGKDYPRDPNGIPILPAFRIGKATLPPEGPHCPPVLRAGDPGSQWTGQTAVSSDGDGLPALQ